MQLHLLTAAGEKKNIPLSSEEQTLAKAIWLSGAVPPPALCSGLGRCGACRVRFLSSPPDPLEKEREVLDETALAEGWRLACRHPARNGQEVALPSVSPAVIRQIPWTGEISPETPFLLAVDLGTTSVQWRAFPVSGAAGPVVEGQALNPQMGAGSEVISRLTVAAEPEGQTRLQELLTAFLRRIVADLPGRVEAMGVAGNTVMTALLLGLDTRSLAAAPYALPTGLEDRRWRQAQLTDLPPLWIPPQPAPFVGGDLSAGMAFLLHPPFSENMPKFPFLLADLGTNGEFVLALNPHEAFITSVPLGPSLEGIGLTHGSVAGEGCIAGFQLGPSGLHPSVLGSGPPHALCGTGYLSLLAHLVRIGLLTPKGRLADQPPTPLARRLRIRIDVGSNGIWQLPLDNGLALTATDVEELLKVKAAFSLALETLLAAASLNSRDLAAIILGGALGEHAPLAALETLGFLPPGRESRVHAAGNTSLRGMEQLLRRPELRPSLETWVRKCRIIDLTDRSDFMDAYIRHMVFGETRSSLEHGVIFNPDGEAAAEIDACPYRTRQLPS